MKKTAAVIAAIVGVLALLFIATEQTAPPEMTEAEIAEAEAYAVQELEARTGAFWDAFKRGDPEEIASFWTSEALLLEPGIRLVGSEITAYMVELAGGGPRPTTYEVEQDFLDWWVHGDAAYGISLVDETLAFEGGEPRTVRRFGFARFEKEDGVWRIDRLLYAPWDAPPEG
jgi:ketosteroid isomerase-like protein